MFTISPSVYSADLLDLRQVLKRLDGFEHLHLDIDGSSLVTGHSFGMDVDRRLAACTDVPLDVHLEVQNPMAYVDDLADAGVELICAHVEALDYPSLFLSSVHNRGKKAGLALNIKTPAVFLEPYVDQLDQVILVSCEADVDGLPFRSGVLKKVAQVRSMLSDPAKVWVDGGVNETNLKSVINAGAGGVVLGRAVFGAKDPVGAYQRLLDLGRTYEKERDGNAV